MDQYGLKIICNLINKIEKNADTKEALLQSREFEQIID